MKRKLIAVLSCVILCTSIFVSCGGDASKDAGGTATEQKADQKGTEKMAASDPSKLPKVAQDRKDTLIVGMSAPVGDFSPIYSSTLYDGWVTDLVFPGLIRTDEKASAQGLVAESYEISEDGKTYTFKLRKGVKFTNGEELTAKDVEFTYRAIADPKYDGARSGYADKLAGYEEYNKGDATSISGIKIIDDYTIEFTNKEPAAAGIWNFEVGIMPESIYGFEKGDIQKLKDQMGKPVGCGPYKFESFKPGQEVTFTKNDNYFEGAPKIPKVVMKVTNATTQIQELVSGNVDIEDKAIGAKPENIEQLKAAGFINLDIYKANSYGYMGLNLESPKLKDKEVRQALAYGLNRKAFMDAYYQGYGEVLNTHILPTSWAYNKDVGDMYPYDPDKANKILDDAGWVDSNKDGSRDKNGVELNISWLTYTGSKYVETLTPIVIDSWEKIGVKVTPELMEFSSMADKVRNAREFEMYNMAWSLSTDPDPLEIFSIEQDKKGGFNSNRWRNEKSEELLKKAAKEMNQEKRKELYAQWQTIFAQDLPYITLGYSKDMSVSSSRVKNYNPSTFMRWTNGVHKLELK